VEARRGGGAKKLSNGWRTAKLGREDWQKNLKNTEIDRKVIQQNTKPKTGMEEAGDEEKGRGHRV
jgi:hypothetical protein